MKIVIAGTGYVGLVTGTCLAEIGNNVTCIDIDTHKIEKLKMGISPIYEPGLDELIKKNYIEKRLNFTSDYQSAYKDADIIFIGVGTPERDDGSANLDYIFNVLKDIANNIRKNCLVVIKSTVPVGTNDKVEEFLKENLVNKVNVEVASNPEFLAQGTAVRDTLYGSRIIIGVNSKGAEEKLKLVYKNFNQPIIVTNRRSAEMIKYASNDFLALKISFINEIANLCEIVGANIEDVTKGMSYDSRIGNKFLDAGIGYGGSCFPKDTKALHWLSNDNGYELKTIKATIEINENQKYKLFRKAKDIFGSLKGRKVSVLGLTFKPGTDDLREAPSIPNVKRLIEEGAKVSVYDPVGVNNFKKIFQNEVNYCNSIEESIVEAEIVFIFTEWGEIKSFDLNKFNSLGNNPVILDGRNCFTIEEAEKVNMNYYSIGRKFVTRGDALNEIFKIYNSEHNTNFSKNNKYLFEV